MNQIVTAVDDRRGYRPTWPPSSPSTCEAARWTLALPASRKRIWMSCSCGAPKSSVRRVRLTSVAPGGRTPFSDCRVRALDQDPRVEERDPVSASASTIHRAPGNSRGRTRAVKKQGRHLPSSSTSTPISTSDNRARSRVRDLTRDARQHPETHRLAHSPRSPLWRFGDEKLRVDPVRTSGFKGRMSSATTSRRVGQG